MPTPLKVMISSTSQDLPEHRQQVMNACLQQMNKGTALWHLTRLNEAVAEYNKAIAIRERLVNEEQQTHLANVLALAYMNKGIALRELTKLNEALTEYDEAIAIFERLVNEEQQTHLANDLATAYVSKALVLEDLSDTEGAIAFYEKSIVMRRICVDELSMYWIVPDLLRVIRYRVMTLVDLARWPEAAVDVSEYLSRLDEHLKGDSIDASLKEAAQGDAVELASRVRVLTSDQQELLYVELGVEAEKLRSLVEVGDGDSPPPQ